MQAQELDMRSYLHTHVATFPRERLAARAEDPTLISVSEAIQVSLAHRYEPAHKTVAAAGLASPHAQRVSNGGGPDLSDHLYVKTSGLADTV